MPRPEELRLTEYGSEDSDYDEDIFNNSIIHSYEKKVRYFYLGATKSQTKL